MKMNDRRKHRTAMDSETRAISTIREVIKFKPSSLQEQIISIAMQLMEQHYLFDSDTLYTQCLRSIKTVRESALNSAIAELLNKHVLIDGKALDKLTLLDNPHRKDIYDLITATPGLNISRIAKNLGLLVTTARWHMDVLEEFHFIRSNRINDQVYYFPAHASEEHDKIHVLLNKNGMTEIIRFIEMTNHPTVSILLRSTSLPKTTLLRKFNQLVENNVIIVAKTSRGDAELSTCDSIKEVLAQRVNGVVDGQKSG